MQLSKEGYARERIHNGSSVQIENSVMPNSYPRDGIFNQHLTTIKDSYILAYRTGISVWLTDARKYRRTPVGCKTIRIFDGCEFSFCTE